MTSRWWRTHCWRAYSSNVRAATRFQPASRRGVRGQDVGIAHAHGAARVFSSPAFRSNSFVSTDQPLEPSVGPIVVAIGASAGGVEALRELFQGLPLHLGAAIIVVTHLGPRRDSLLAEILARDTKLKVSVAADGQELLPDHVYVQPPETVLTVEDGKLMLRSLQPNESARNPIDVCFASLAYHLKDRVVGIILSGAGSDGTLGLKSIKEEGGLTIAQGHNGTGPQYEDMPASAIASGIVDLELPAEQIGHKLLEYIRSDDALQTMVEENGRQLRDEGADTALKEICDTLRR